MRGIKNQGRFAGIVVLGLLYCIFGLVFIFNPIFHLIKVIDLTEVALGFALLVFGITVLFFAEQVRGTANFYFDEKKGILMDYNQKISKIDAKNFSDDFEYVLDRVECDLRALSNWKIWALPEKQEDLINNYVIKIINNALSADTCKNNRKEICKLMQVSLEIAPNHKELIKLNLEENCAKLLMKGK